MAKGLRKNIAKSLGNSRGSATVVVVVIIVAVIVVGAITYIVATDFFGKDVADEDTGMAFDAFMIIDESDLDDIEKVEPGRISLNMAVSATSSDGTEFGCMLANSERNEYNAYITIILDSTGDELYRTGLLPPGSRIESFTSNVKVPKGSHEGTMIFTQVEDDNKTIHTQNKVELTLIVNS